MHGWMLRNHLQALLSITLHYATITFVVVGSLGSLKLYNDI